MAGTQLTEHNRSGDRVDEDLIASPDNDDGRRPLRLLSAISRRAGLVLCLLGVLGAAPAVVGLRPGGSPQPQSWLEPRTVPWAVADASTVRTSGPAELVVQTMTYVPGQTSGWHSHPGLHLVSVVSGTLTVYGPDCQARSYGPGEPYIGGDRVHLARNEGEVPVEMGVIYLTTPGQSIAGFRLSHQAPATCSVQ